MKRLALLWLLLLFALPARADLTLTLDQTVVDGRQQRTWSHTWTTVANSTVLDVSACVRLEQAFDPSTGDASTDAKYNLRTCQTATTSRSQCSILPAPHTLGEGAFGAVSGYGDFVMVEATAATSGGDTAEFQLRCTGASAELAELGTPEIRQAEDFLAGSDWGQAVNAAYADCIAESSSRCTIQLPKSGFLAQTTPIDFCDVSGATNNASVVLRGHGANRGGGSGSLLIAQSGLRQAATTGTFSVSAGTGVGGRDQITCAGCDFRSAAGGSYRRGDYLTTTDFTDPANNITDSEVPLMVWRAEATALTVESITSLDAGLVGPEAGTGNEDIQKLAFQLRTCRRNVTLEDFELNGTLTSEFADIGLLSWTDGSVADECTDPDDPYDYCTGDAAGTGQVNNTVTFLKMDGLVLQNQKWVGYMLGALSTSSQADQTTITHSNFGFNSRVGAWVDQLQAQPNILIHDVAFGNTEKYGIYSTAGGFHLDQSDYANGNSDCLVDTFGECWMIFVENNNRDDISIENSALEVTGGDGIHVAAGAGGFAPFAIRDSQIYANYDPDPTAIKLLDFDNGGLLTISGTRFNTTASGVTVPPTVTISDSNAGAPDLSLFADFTLSGGGAAPVATINNGIRNRGQGKLCFERVASTPAATNADGFLFKLDHDFTVSDIDCIVSGTTSAVVTVQECSATGGSCGTTEAAITCDADGAAESGAIDDPDIDAGDWVNLDFGTITGTPVSATVQVCGS